MVQATNERPEVDRITENETLELLTLSRKTSYFSKLGNK